MCVELVKASPKTSGRNPYPRVSSISQSSSKEPKHARHARKVAYGLLHTMELSRHHVILAAITTFFAWGYSTHYIPSLRFVPHATVAGAALTVLGLLWWILSTSQPKEHNEDELEGYGHRHVAFIEPQAWKQETAALRRRMLYESKSLYPESPVVTQALDKLLILILRDYINGWYSAISRRPTFTNEVDRAIRSSIESILGRLRGLDIVGVGVSRIVPIFTNHMSDSYEAERAVRGRKLTRNVTESDELDLAIATKFRNGKIHPAASLAFSDTKTVQQQYLRSVVMRLLPKVLPQDMTTSPAVTVVIREIVACAVLAPVIRILADPDTWNQVLEAYGKNLLQERKTIRKLRAALDEHAPSSPRPVRSVPFPKLSPEDNERKFEQFIRATRKVTTISDARRFRSEVASQLVRESAVEGQDPLYLRRLETGKRILDQKIALLGAGGSTQPKQKLRLKNTGQLNRTRSSLEGASLRQVLYNASGLSYFMEYMDRQHLMRLVQFWVVVDGLRNPLEEDAEDPSQLSLTSKTWTESDRADIAQINDAYLSKPEIKITGERREAVRTFLKAGSTATDGQYHTARKSILRTQTAGYEEMQEHFKNFKRSDLWFKLLASDEASAISSTTPKSGEPPTPILEDQPYKGPSKPIRPHTSLEKAKPPDLHRTAVSSSDLKSLFKPTLLDSETPPRRSLDIASSERRPLFGDDIDTDPLARSTASLDSDRDSENVMTNGENAQVVDALQAALNNIMEEQPEMDKDSLLSEPSLKSPHDNDSARGSLDLLRPASPMPMKEREKPSIASLGLVGDPARRSFLDEKIFAEEEKFLEDEREDSDANDKSDEDEIHQAAPGDLGLAEAIDALTLDIEKLVTQESIIDSLTRKAELTNNTAELRILKKSKSSIQREINRKELQRQQYIIQESDNSLYGRATVSIKSIMVGTDEDGKEFALYVIEVNRAAGEQMPAATWVVARRYSEFHQLNKRLRARYPSIRSLDFPRRQVVLKLQKDFLQKRRVMLERYLQELLKVPAICRSREFRAFLSQQSLPSTSPSSSQVDTRDFVSRIYNSVTDGMEEFLGNIPVLDQLSLAGQNLISAATTQLNATTTPTATLTSTPVLASASASTDELAATAEAEAELRAFETRELEPFVKPICDFFLEVFELNRENNWLRGRAVVVVLHQLLGGTIERKVRESANSQLSDESVAKSINQLIDVMWPGGVMRTAPPLRTLAEKARSRKEAGLVLASLVPELVGNVVGRLNAQAAARRMLATLNNERLNTHLVFTLLDEVVSIVFGDAPSR